MQNDHSEINTPKSELEKRIARLQDALRKCETDGALILQNTDLFYFAGTIQQAHLYVPAEGQPILMVRRSLARANAESAIERIVPFKNPRQIPDILQQNGYALPRILGMELDVLPVNLHLSFSRIFEDAKLPDISHEIRLIRAVKSAYETNMIREACRFSDHLASCVRTFLQEGITEIELAGKIEAEARKLGHQGIVRMRLWGSELFYGHLMAGASAAVPSFLSSPTGGQGVGPAVAQGPSLSPIRPHEPVLLDYCFVYRGYISDHARIFSMGELPDDLCMAHQAMLDVQSLIIRKARPGMKAGDVYDLALARADELGYADHFMGVGPRRIRFVGHGVGLELDEYPFLAKGQDMELQSGMTVAIEPKVIFPGKGVVGIENTHVMTDDGLEQLTHFEEGVVTI
ncbi:MAG: peptidase M24 [Desulfobacteraceae bacterium 4572_88]|nr:MAG: peptidase M24 [Desulfobacteraceae bacterium 4572_88]